MTQAMTGVASQASRCFPVSIYYAFKQPETRESAGTAGTGWETFLAAVMEAGLAIMGTWPVRTEREGRSSGTGANALAPASSTSSSSPRQTSLI